MNRLEFEIDFVAYLLMVEDKDLSYEKAREKAVEQWEKQRKEYLHV